MANRILRNDEIESISLSSLVNNAPRVVVTNTGLSPELIKEFSADISDDFIITLLRIKLGDVWRNFSNDPTEKVGVDENGRPIYKTVWNNEDWAYIPFDTTLDTVKASGEIVGNGLSIANYDKEIAISLEQPTEGVSIKLYYISKKTGQLIVKDEYKYLTGQVNTGVQIQGETVPADILNEQCPSNSYDGIQFRR